jgi:hypothetical protein
MAVLETFAKYLNIELDFTELAEQAKEMEEQLGQILAKVEEAISEQQAGEEDSWPTPEAEEERLSPEDRQRIERLFEQAQADKTKAYELKKLLDRLEVFKDYEDRFLDLFAKRGGGEKAA